TFDFVREMLRRRTGSLEYDFRGDERMAVFHTLEPIDWLVGLAVSRGEVYAPLFAFMRAIGGIIDVALACVKRIEQGDLPARVAHTGPDDEVAALQRGIDAMGERIERRTREQ